MLSAGQDCVWQDCEGGSELLQNKKNSKGSMERHKNLTNRLARRCGWHRRIPRLTIHAKINVSSRARVHVGSAKRLFLEKSSINLSIPTEKMPPTQTIFKPLVWDEQLLITISATFAMLSLAMSGNKPKFTTCVFQWFAMKYRFPHITANLS